MPDIKTVAIVGGGLIGASWAALFTAGGIDVVAWDPDATARALFRERVNAARRQLAKLGYRGRGKLKIVARLKAAVADADLIQENAPEKLELKHRLFAEIVAAAKPQATIASSTSSFAWSALTEGMKEPSRLIVSHPFNPPHLVPLVELFGTDAARVQAAAVFYEAMGKVTIRMKREAPGHVANRLASALWREAVHIVAEGIADVADVDRALVEGPGLRWSIQGAHMTYHLGGGEGGIRHYLDHLGPSQEKRWAALGSPSLTPEVKDMLVQGVENEAAGRSISELSAERDATLIEALKLRAKQKRKM
ncbi:MAG: 3-hydroxyacyl-CoA dehydrogenase NAD-binding domain-containing protein [Ferrovibrio sp.]|uniref:3-hydroxyacyl-CoA dehydrogenase NAD-binding domain-containing protein n=1 Tax=Ferrovibrio sp. TaxID=1917215 RepID=UPI00260A2795|nr:3-hydroxyacyl-CoA dehydrogenase NAD-binding domain-containing protein [Ferrovibrio sp.]MCW0234208.1 3-hydroxyacyl-CoA dehydrogenase NAD-binding domain-containing protein [Ferrovibrio sp.]